ncbi:MAG: hypothetical protein Q9186_001504 [Xanthomendoza sp. 1 TL-2023]
MADILTQLQDCLDQLSTQFYASYRYLTTHHPSLPTLPPNPHNPPFPASDHNPHQRPDTPTTFASAQGELASDLVEKVKEIEFLISQLPGLESSEESQVERIRQLEDELKKVEGERGAAVRKRDEWVEVLEGLISRVGRLGR